MAWITNGISKHIIRLYGNYELRLIQQSAKEKRDAKHDELGMNMAVGMSLMGE
jgi:hypothetical protein